MTRAFIICSMSRTHSQIVLLTDMTKQSELQQPIKKANIYLIGGVAAMAGLLFGFDTGVISGAQEFLFKTFEVGGLPYVDLSSPLFH